MMDVKDLKVFLAVADHLNFTRAGSEVQSQRDNTRAYIETSIVSRTFANSPYSCLRATIGSTLLARKAGSKHATNAAISNRNDTAPKA
jgi:hypothetical protein